MYLFKSVSDFLLSVWLWSITFDLGHIVAGAVILYFFLHIALGWNMWQSIGLSVSSYAASFGVFMLLALSMFHFFVGGTYQPLTSTKDIVPIDVFLACLLVAGTYSVLQSIFFAFISGRCAYTYMSHVFAIFMANGIAAVINYTGIRFALWYAI